MNAMLDSDARKLVDSEINRIAEVIQANTPVLISNSRMFGDLRDKLLDEIRVSLMRVAGLMGLI